MAFELDDVDASLPFTRRLARENRWEIAYAVRVVREYKRFVYMALRAGHTVTPSVAVDQAWHLHLLYSRSYWHDLCGGVLGCELHHGPTRGGAAEGGKHRDQYQCTLDSYECLFGEKPPIDIWPSVDGNFSDAASWVYVNRSAFWLVPKPVTAVRQWFRSRFTGGKR
jgi:hypothetical protein